MAAEPLQIADSSHVKGASYDSDTQELAVTFPGGSTYVYSGIPPEIAADFSAAPSAGSYLHKVIKAAPDKYPYRKL